MNKIDARILVVEDEPMLRFVVEKQLRALGYSVSDFAENGLEAVRKALEKKYNMIFMDVRLSGIDGVIATAKIREAENKMQRRTPIIGITAFDQKERCLEAGMDDFLQKPVTLVQLEESISKWLVIQPEFVLKQEVAPAVQLDDFSQRNSELEDLKERIERLRKLTGLE